MPFELMDYQKTAALYVINHLRCIVVMKPGRGKTAVILGAIKVLRKKGTVSTSLIWTHKRGMDAYRKLTAGLPIHYVETSQDLRDFREEFEADPDRVFVVNTGLINKFEEEWNPKYRKETESFYETGEEFRAGNGELGGETEGGKALFSVNTPTHHTTTTTTTITTKANSTTLLRERSFLYYITQKSNLVAVDEIHNYREPSNSTSQGLSILMRACRGRVVGLTATPFYKKLEDSYQLYSYVDPRIFGSFSTFQSNFLIIITRQSQAYCWVSTPTGKRKLLVPITIPEVVGYRNQDVFMERVKDHLYLDPGSSFAMNFHPVSFDLRSHAGYLSVVKGEGLSTSCRLALAGPRSTVSVVFLKGETVKVVKTSYDSASDGSKVERKTSYDSDPLDVVHGTTILRQTREGVEEFQVIGKAKELSEGDIIARIGPLVRYMSSTPEQLQALMFVLDPIPSSKGAVIFCQYLETVDFLVEQFKSYYPGRNVVTITGGEPDMQGVIDGAGEDSFIIISRVAAQSIDFFYDTLVVYEPVTTPGGVDQLLGRVTRLSSKFREVSFYFIVGKLTISHYFYERLLYLMSNNPYSQDVQMEHIPLKGLDFSSKKTSLKTLKTVLLWRKAYQGLEEESGQDYTDKTEIRKIKIWD